MGVRYRVDKETTYLTLAYFSIYESSDIRWYTSSENTEILNAQNTDSSKMLALALFAISSKFNDIYNVSIEQLTRSFGEKYRNSIIILEHRILEILDFQVPEETPYTLFYEYCQGNQ